MDIIRKALFLYYLCIFGRILLSWFPISRGSPMESVYSFLYTITEPVLGPVRRAIPPIGMMDVSPLIVIFGLTLLMSRL